MSDDSNGDKRLYKCNLYVHHSPFRRNLRAHQRRHMARTADPRRAIPAEKISRYGAMPACCLYGQVTASQQGRPLAPLTYTSILAATLYLL